MKTYVGAELALRLSTIVWVGDRFEETKDDPTPMDIVLTGHVLRGGYDRYRSAVLLVDGINTPGAPVWVGLGT